MLGLELGVEFLAGASTGWDLGTFLGNAATTLKTWFNALLLIVGLVAIVYGTWQIASGLMSHGKKQVNWAIAIVLVLFGGALATGGGFNFMSDIAAGGEKTIKDLGGQTIVLFQYGKMFFPF